ncbi:hypothetical protein COC69_02045 [Bacillus cereus]|uniref:Zinc-finger domain-containing protein n=1 Tax=Bacillus cereus TaxID=1396 RepID=A0A9X7GXY8_BACCE|nr:helix-turn-helix transcriptional regulator [Bacillus cereus]PGS83531.1 hypothetical protein COC69_02045 [Bacillus cereus]
MNKKEKRIRILNLQDYHCHMCENKMKPLKICIKCCEVGKELNRLGREIFEINSRVIKNREQWDNMCEKAEALSKAEGMTFTGIAEQLGCSRTTLREQLKKRGLWKGESSAIIQKQARKKWDGLCQKALQLRVEGISYPKIAEILEVPASNLRNEMKKRGFHKEI